jgi:hypothetical protein
MSERDLEPKPAPSGPHGPSCDESGAAVSATSRPGAARGSGDGVASLAWDAPDRLSDSRSVAYQALLADFWQDVKKEIERERS